MISQQNAIVLAEFLSRQKGDFDAFLRAEGKPSTISDESIAALRAHAHTTTQKDFCRGETEQKNHKTENTS